MRQLLVAIVCTVLLGTTSHAFKPGPDIIRKCPKCGQTGVLETTMSGNTFGATFWTDGKIEAPMLPDRPWLVKCPKCSNLFWIDEAEKIGEREFGKKMTWDGALLFLTPSEDDYHEFLCDSHSDPKKEKYLRIRAWHSTNDKWRNESETFYI